MDPEVLKKVKQILRDLIVAVLEKDNDYNRVEQLNESQLVALAQEALFSVKRTHDEAMKQLANVKELQELPGVGQVTAQRIIDMRQKSGRFHRVEDLLAVRGISQKKLDAMRPYVTISAPPPTASPAPKSGSPAAKKP